MHADVSGHPEVSIFAFCFSEAGDCVHTVYTQLVVQGLSESPVSAFLLNIGVPELQMCTSYRV